MNTKRCSPIKALLIGIVCLMNFPILAQTAYTLSAGPELKVTGTSTLHDWEMKSATAIGKAQISLENGKIQTIKNMTVDMPAESIKSGKSGMDKNAYEAMKIKQHKQVKFTLKEFSAKENAYVAMGDFTIAGVTKSAKFPVTVSQTGDKLTFKGSYPFKLTDYNIDPPTALLGTVKTGNEVSIHFNITFQPQK